MTEASQEIIHVLKLEARCIDECAERLSNIDQRKQLDKTLQLLCKSLDDGGKIVVTGVGKSGKIGQKIAATLTSTGSFSVFLHPTEGLHGDLGIIKSNDVVLALSSTGNTEELLRLIPSLKQLKIPMIALCGNAHSQLVKFSDTWIDASVAQEACPHNLAPTTSTTLSLAIGDALAVALMKMRNFNVESFAKNHPGGSIGKKINLTVNDLMQKESALALLSPHAAVDEVVVRSTEKKLGAVLITASATTETPLLGIITDGDLRRALKHREKFFTLCANDIMTHNPISVTPETLAYDALKLMENRPSQISVLPVVSIDSSGKKLKGLIRLHDLLREF